MKIVYSVNKKYEPLLLINKDRAESNFGYETVVYDAGGLGYGTPIPNVPVPDVKVPYPDRFSVCMRKPYVILDALEKTSETVVYLDADAFIVKAIDDIEDDQFDVGLTYKGAKARINAGVCFFKNTDRSKIFVENWIRYMEKSFVSMTKRVKPQQLGDNIFLQTYIRTVYSPRTRLKNRTVDFHDSQVKFFDTFQWNNWFISNSAKRAFIENDIEGAVKALTHSKFNDVRIVHMVHSYKNMQLTLDVLNLWGFDGLHN